MKLHMKENVKNIYFLNNIFLTVIVLTKSN